MKNPGASKLTKLCAMFLSCAMLFSASPVIALAGEADTSTPVSDMTVASSVYGWATSDASTETDEDDGSVHVTIEMVPAGSSEAQTYTTAVSYGICNTMTDTNEADVITSRCKSGSLVEICLNAAGEVIDMRRVLQSGLFFDTAKYGGDLTEIGSTVEYRGADYTDYDNSTGATGVMTGLSGNMVASGWILGKTNNSIRIGDGNMTTEVFNETYTLDTTNLKVYEVDSEFASTEKDLNSVPVTAANAQGNIYDTSARYQAVVVFDKSYADYDTAKVIAIYYYATPSNVDKFVGLIPQSVPVTSDYSLDTQGTPKPYTATYLTSADPITVVDDKMWTVGDIEVNCYLFKGGSDGHDGHQLAMFDFGWTLSGYQYWKNIETCGEDPRDLDMLLVSHGHGDHYGDAFDAWEMIVRSGNTCEVYETYEDTMGYDIYDFPEIEGMFTDAPFRSIITNWYNMDEWFSYGNGLEMYPTLTPGHTQGVCSAIFQVTVASEMDSAKCNSEKNAEGVWEQNYANYNQGDEIFFVYMGGYGINGLANLSKGYLRDAFYSSLRYLQSVVVNTKTSTGADADGIYNLPQHTNQFPYLETEQLREEYNTNNGTDYPFLHFLREGKDEVINFCEKRASAVLYSDYTSEYMTLREANGGNDPVYTFDGQDYTVGITSTAIKGQTVEDVGPFKHDAGEALIHISDDVDVLVMHGYDAFLNKGVVAADTFETAKGYDVNKGFVIAKECFVNDPDAWYVQIAGNVLDDYNGCVYGDDFTDGPVEAMHDNWNEIMRTEAMTKDQAEALAASLSKGGYYKVDLKATGDINLATDYMDTFEPIETAVKYSTQTTIVDGVANVSLYVENAPKLNTVVLQMAPAEGITFTGATATNSGTYTTAATETGTRIAFIWPDNVDATERTLVGTMTFNVTGNGDVSFNSIEVGQYVENDTSYVSDADSFAVSYAIGSSADLYDVSGDALVSTADLSLLVHRYMAAAGESNYASAYDFNCDGVIDILDFTNLLIHFD